MLRLFPALALAAALASCSGDERGPNAGEDQPAGVSPADYRTDLSMQELMAHVIDPAADGIWLKQGWTVTDVEVELFPQTEEEWLAVENSALTLAESANLLLLPGRPRDEDRAWVDYSHRLYATAMKAHDAAEARDKTAFFDAGGDIYVVCRDCHQQYILGETN